MKDSLLQEFLDQDCDASRRKLLHKEIVELLAEKSQSIREHTFNRFDLTLDFASGLAVLEDDLDSTVEGRCELPIQDFDDAINPPVSE